MSRAIGKYELIEELGHGGMATVWRARDTVLKRHIALKVLHPHLRGAGEARKRFGREAESVARLKHPHILEIYDYSGSDSEDGFIAAELLDGPNLKRFIENEGRLMPEVAAAIGIQLASALEAAHANGVVHRDVKPENILLHQGTLKLADFGIAHITDNHTMTATGQILGSPGHMAPEQVEGGLCDARSDIFSLGTVLYYVVCGQLPFTGRNTPQILLRIVEGDYVYPTRVHPDIGDGFAKIIAKAMNKDPKERYPDAASFKEALTRYLSVRGHSDPAQLVQEAFSDVGAIANKLRPLAVRTETDLGRAALSKKDRVSANDHLGRVLALDPGRSEIRRLLDKSRPQSLLKVIGVTLTILGVAASGLAAWNYARPPRHLPRPSDPAVNSRPVTRPPPTKAAPNPVTLLNTPGIDETNSVEARTANGSQNGGTPQRPRPAPTASTQVAFDISPENVSISVDGAPPRAFGPDFYSIALSPGPHRFVIHTDLECCETAEFTRNIPDSERYVLQAVLPSRPAILIVRSNVAADVSIDQGPARRARTPISITLPRGARTEQVSVQVSAPGYQTREISVEVRAGTAIEVPVELSVAPTS